MSVVGPFDSTLSPGGKPRSSLLALSAATFAGVAEITVCGPVSSSKDSTQDGAAREFQAVLDFHLDITSHVCLFVCFKPL